MEKYYLFVRSLEPQTWWTGDKVEPSFPSAFGERCVSIILILEMGHTTLAPWSCESVLYKGDDPSYPTSFPSRFPSGNFSWVDRQNHLQAPGASPDSVFTVMPSPLTELSLSDASKESPWVTLPLFMLRTKAFLNSGSHPLFFHHVALGFTQHLWLEGWGSFWAQPLLCP